MPSTRYTFTTKSNVAFCGWMEVQVWMLKMINCMCSHLLDAFGAYWFSPPSMILVSAEEATEAVIQNRTLKRKYQWWEETDLRLYKNTIEEHSCDVSSSFWCNRSFLSCLISSLVCLFNDHGVWLGLIFSACCMSAVVPLWRNGMEESWLHMGAKTLLNVC